MPKSNRPATPAARNPSARYAAQDAKLHALITAYRAARGAGDKLTADELFDMIMRQIPAVRRGILTHYGTNLGGGADARQAIDAALVVVLNRFPLTKTSGITPILYRKTLSVLEREIGSWRRWFAHRADEEPGELPGGDAPELGGVALAPLLAEAAREGAIKPIERTILSLKALGKTDDQIAARVGRSRSAVQERAARAIEKIRRWKRRRENFPAK